MVGTRPAEWRVIFAGTPEFAAVSLEALVAKGIRPVAVLTQPDRPAGRGRKLQASAVKAVAEMHGLPVLQPESLKDPSAIAELAALKPDLMIVVAYGQILTQSVLDLPALGCLNVHASILPRWRGAAPIQRALLAGDSETGVSIMRMEAGLDSGPVYATVRTPIEASDTGGSLHDRLAALGAKALLEVLQRLSDPTCKPAPQVENEVSWARKLSKDEAWLDWRRPARELVRQVRAFNPWPVSQTRLDGEVLRIWEAKAEQGMHGVPPGTVLKADADGVLVAAGEGALRLLSVQRPGGRPIRASELANQRALSGLTLA